MALHPGRLLALQLVQQSRDSGPHHLPGAHEEAVALPLLHRQRAGLREPAGPAPPPSAYTGPPGPPPAPTPPPAPGIPPPAAWTSPAAIVQSAVQSVGTSNDSLALRMTVLDDQVTDVSHQLRRLNDALCVQGLPRPPQGAAPNSSMPPTSTPTTAAASATADKITELEDKVVRMTTLLQNLLSRVGRLETTVRNPGETEEQNQSSDDGFLVSPTP